MFFLILVFKDIDECNQNKDNCDANAECTNEVPFFSCSCNDGYKGDGTIGDCTSKLYMKLVLYL